MWKALKLNNENKNKNKEKKFYKIVPSLTYDFIQTQFSWRKNKT